MKQSQVWTVREGERLIVSGPAEIVPLQTRPRDGRRVVVEVTAEEGIFVTVVKSEKKSA